MQPALIGKVAAPFGELSNMSAHAITDETGKRWPRAEHLFQAMRFPVDCPIREEIRAISNPMAAKMLAKSKTAQMTVERGGPVDLDNMRIVLRMKHAQHAAVRAALLATGQRLIIEDCSRRRSASGLFWGAWLDTSAEIPTWRGQNWLGRLWCEIRDAGKAGGARY